MEDQTNNTNSNNQNQPGNGNGGNGREPQFNGSRHTAILIIISVVLALVFWLQFNNFRAFSEKEVTYDKFLDAVDDRKVDSVEIKGSKIFYTLKEEKKSSENIKYFVVRTDDYDLVNRLHSAGVTFKEIDSLGSEIIKEIVSTLLMVLIFFIFISYITKRAGNGGIFDAGKAKAKIYGMQKNTGVTFKDVAGEEEAKESLAEMVDFLKRPDKYLEIGAHLPKGALLVGQPGTGKTLLAKAVAGEAGVPFFSISGSEFIEMYVGVGASRVRDLFKQAEAKAPCIIFIDEIDAIGRSRDTRHQGGDSEREQTLNQLLAEMDGFDTAKGIIVLAATNRPEVLDKALLRPGRFDRRVIVDSPDLIGREQILRVHSKNVKMDETVDLHELAYATSGSVGADLSNIINEAALTAVRKHKKYVSQEDLIESVEVVFAGKEKKDRIMGPEEKKIVAYHEAGHALLTILQKHTMPVQKITIIPRTMGSLGYVWQTPEEEKFLETQAEMEAHLVIAMGGRAAEALKFSSVTSGAANDIEQATNEARQMVTRFGMSEKFGMVQLETVTGEYLDSRSMLQCADETAAKIDSEVKNIIKKAYGKAFKLLKKNENVLDAVAAYLVENESITGKEFISIYNKITGETVEANEIKNIDFSKRNTISEKHDSNYDMNNNANCDTHHNVNHDEYLTSVQNEEKNQEKSKSTYHVYASEEFYKHRDEILNNNEFHNDGVPDDKIQDIKDEQEEVDTTPKPWEIFAEKQKNCLSADNDAETEENAEKELTEEQKEELDGESKEGIEEISDVSMENNSEIIPEEADTSSEKKNDSAEE